MAAGARMCSRYDLVHRRLSIRLPRLGDRPGVGLSQLAAFPQELALALGSVARRQLHLDPPLAPNGLGPGQQALGRPGRRVEVAAGQLEELTVEAVADGAPHVLLDQPPGEV